MNNNKPAIRHIFSFLMFLLPLIFSMAGCAKHAAPTAAKVEKETSSTVARETPAAISKLEDSLTAAWRLDRIEMPDMLDKATSFGSQAERDNMNQKISKYQEQMKGLTVTFTADKKFTSSYNNQSDVGTWRLTKQNDIETMSNTTNSITAFQFISLTGNTLVVKYNPGDALLLMTFIKK